MTAVTAAPLARLLTLRVENRSGVLVRIAGLFARRGYNIVSLAVAPSEDERFSRVSVVVGLESAPLHQIIEQLDKLVNVVEIVELAPGDALESELLLATVAAPRAALEDVIAEVGGSVVDESATATTVRLVAHPDDLDRFTDTLGTFGVVELQRTGRIALPKLT